MGRKTRLILALTGILVVSGGELMAVFQRAWATTPTFLMGFAAISALGFWAMSFHRLGQ